MSADSINSKRDHELRTFEQFCAAARLTIVPGTIVQPDPPAPDLSAELETRGRTAFELVRLNHPDQLTRLSLMHQTPQFLADAFAALPEELRTRLSSIYADGIITIHFRGAVNLSERRRALPFVWDTLASQPAGFVGKVDLWDLGAPEAIELIWVNRGKTFGVPYFKTQTAGYVLPLAADRVGEKLQKHYQCAEPLELLAYVHWGELAHANAADEIAAVAAQYLPGSQFRRVWVYEGLLQRVALQFQNFGRREGDAGPPRGAF
jgi:hypothetical protein